MFSTTKNISEILWLMISVALNPIFSTARLLDLTSVFGRSKRLKSGNLF